jgi:hypothetical protein
LQREVTHLKERVRSIFGKRAKPYCAWLFECTLISLQCKQEGELLKRDLAKFRGVAGAEEVQDFIDKSKNNHSMT